MLPRVLFYGARGVFCCKIGGVFDKWRASARGCACCCQAFVAVETGYDPAQPSIVSKALNTPLAMSPSGLFICERNILKVFVVMAQQASASRPVFSRHLAVCEYSCT
jgi:hypothetical protein